MPGIFGVAPLDGRRPADPAELDATFDRLASALRHDPVERIDRYVDASRGLAIGRIGRTHLHGAPWPSAAPAGAVFASGHPGGLAESRPLSGFYAAAIVDDDGVTLQADRTGSHRLFWGIWNGRVYFAPEISALLSLPGAPRDVDLAAFGTALASRLLYRDQTLFAGLRRLCGGTRLRIGAGSARIEEYWRFTPGAQVRPEGLPDLAMEMADLLRAATARHFGDTERTIFFLSGGRDCRALLAAALDMPGVQPSALSCVTWADHEGASDSDLSVARQLAAITGVRHQTMWRTQDDFGARFERMNVLLAGASQMALDHPSEVEVMARLSAQGYQRSIRGDQIIMSKKPPVFSLEQAWRLYNLRRLGDTANAVALLAPDRRRDIAAAADTVFEDMGVRYAGMDFNDAKDAIYFDVRLQSYLFASTCWRQLYFDERCPLLDDAVIDFVAGTPQPFRLEASHFDVVTAALWGNRPAAPYADGHGLHYLPDLIAPGGPAEAYVVAQIEDGASGVWAYLDQDEARRLLAGLRSGPKRQSLLKRVMRGARDTLRRVDPRLTQNVSTAVKRSSTSPVGLLSSVLILKHWHDHFIAQRPPVR